MRSRLTPAHYISDELFALEQQRVFRRLWIFAGLHSALSEPGAYLTREIGGVPVVVINQDGTLRAFENLCPHRQMPIFLEDFGQGRAVCPYHGWVFDSEGVVKTIPNAETLYAYTAAERATLRLRPFAVELVGELVFVNLSASPLPIDEQFGPEFRATISSISGHFGAHSIHADIDAAYNWKINYENVLDYNHVPYIHPKTFLPLLDKESGIDPGPAPQHDAQENTSDDLRPLSFHKHSPLKITPAPWHEQVDRYCGAGADVDRYYNTFIYPNVNFISVGGLVFLIQQFHPVAPNRTEVRFTLCAARETRRLPGLPAILWGHLRAEVAVLHEDRGYLEALQKALHTNAPIAEHGIYEHHLIASANAYLRLMEQA